MSCTRFLSATLDDVTKSFSCDCFSRVQSYHMKEGQQDQDVRVLDGKDGRVLVFGW